MLKQRMYGNANLDLRRPPHPPRQLNDQRTASRNQYQNHFSAVKVSTGSLHPFRKTALGSNERSADSSAAVGDGISSTVSASFNSHPVRP